jgi:hypothetical protein
MRKRWTISPHNQRAEVPPMDLAVRLERYLAHPTAGGRRRLRHALNTAYGEALRLRGAVKHGKLAKLKTYADQIQGYVIPFPAQQFMK